MASKPFIPDEAFCRTVVTAVAKDMKILPEQIEQPLLAGERDEKRVMARLLAVAIAYQLGGDLCYPPMAELLTIPSTSIPTLAAAGLKRKGVFAEQFERVLKAVKAKTHSAAVA